MMGSAVQRGRWLAGLLLLASALLVPLGTGVGSVGLENLWPALWGHGTDPAGLHDMLVKAVEKPLLEVVMQQSQNNQSRAAQWLGLNRNTLRKKLLEHRLID